MKRIFAIIAVIALMAVPVGPAFAGSGGNDCNSNNQQVGVANNTNVLGSQQNQQGSCNDQEDNDTGGLIGDVL